MAQIDKLQKAKEEFFDDMVKRIAEAFDGIDETEKAEKMAELGLQDNDNKEALFLSLITSDDQTLRTWCECIEDIEYADEEIVENLVELMKEYRDTRKQELKEKFATMERGTRFFHTSIIKFVEKLIDILQNGRYCTSEEENLGKESSSG